MYYIYKMCHTTTGRIYIGQRKLPKGKTPETDSYMGSGKIWKRIFKAHPEECVKVILEVVDSKDEADALEKKYIAHYRSVYGGLCVNIADGGQGGSGCGKGEKNPMFGKHHSEEARRKISEGHKGKPSWNKGKKCPQLSEMQLGEKNHMFGKHLSEEHRRKLSESHSGEKNHFFGKHHSEESIKKISEAHKGKKGPFLGKQFTEEHRKNLSESHKGQTPWNKGLKGEKNPNFGKHHSEETRRKISEALKNRKDNA